MTGAITKAVLGDWGYSHDEIPDMADKVVLITGGSAGIGFEVAKALAAKHAKVIATGRPPDVEEARQAMKGGEAEVHTSSVTGLNSETKAAAQVQWEPVDFEDLNAVHKVAIRLASELKRLDVLILNAGLGVNQFKPTKDGFDRHLTVNNLAHTILANQLLPLMRKTAETADAGSVRIVGQSSELHRGEMLRDVKFASVDEFRQDIGSASLYDRTKLAVILFHKGLVKHVFNPNNDKLLSFSTHPGAVATGQQEQLPSAFGETVGSIVRNVTKPLARSPEHGSLCILWASVAPDAAEFPNGSYFSDPKEPGKETSQASSNELMDNYWRTSQEVIKQVVPDGLIGWSRKVE